MQEIIEKCWNNRNLLKDSFYVNAIKESIDNLNVGKIRIADNVNNQWKINEWLKKAVLLYFSTQEMQYIENQPFSFYDKIPLKNFTPEMGIRVVPNAVVRHGVYIAKNVIVMPSYINIGAYIDEGTMIDTYAMIGSCAQIGKNVHLSANVGIGGVLEPLQAQPVIIEDDCFIGMGCSIVEGILVKRGAVLASHVVLTASTKIIDVTETKPVEYKGFVPENSVVIPGHYAKTYPAGTFYPSCALIIGKRKESTDKKTALTEALRNFNL